MENVATKAFKVFLYIVTVFLILFFISFVNHRIQLNREKEIIQPKGKVVNVKEHNMSVYIEGKGPRTLVFLSGGGTVSPILDFKSLYSLLSDKYTIVVIEKFGYGFSDNVTTERTLDTILDESRLALSQLNVKGPFILCPHSMSGIQALYWAKKYPKEVSAIIGLDMATPNAYKNFEIPWNTVKIGSFAARMGLTRFIPNVWKSDAITHGTLKDSEAKLYKALFFAKTANETMLNEVSHIKEDAAMVEKLGTPNIPMLVFSSDGNIPGFDREEWIKEQTNLAKNNLQSKLIQYECPHYIHDYKYQEMSKEIDIFLQEIDLSALR